MTPFEQGYSRTMKCAGFGASDVLETAGRALESPILRDAGAVAGVGTAAMQLGDPKFWTSSPVDRVYYRLTDEDDHQAAAAGAAAAGASLLGLAHPRTRRASREVLDALGEMTMGL